MAKMFGVSIQHFFLQCVVVISSLFCRLNQSCFNQDFYVMGNGRLRQVNHGLDFGTLSTPAFIGDKVQDLKPVGITKGFRNLFHLFNRQIQYQYIEECKCINFLQNGKFCRLPGRVGAQDFKKIRN